MSAARPRQVNISDRGGSYFLEMNMTNNYRWYENITMLNFELTDSYFLYFNERPNCVNSITERRRMVTGLIYKSLVLKIVNI